jgi:4-phytase/acid phosphatase
MRLHSLYFNLAQGTFYPAQVQGSNLASHILQTIDQAVSGRADPGAFGTPGQKLVVVVGHDTNISNLGGLLGLSWCLPGTQQNPLLPGGALVFELRQRRSDHQFRVRTYYLSQTLEQMRTLEPLTLKNPPALAPIFIPGCSEAGPGFDAPLDKFAALLRRVIDPEFVRSSPN